MESETGGFAESVVGGKLLARVQRRLARFPVEAQVVAVAVFLGALVLLPYLGAVGLWDPWETHYGEVGRSMIHRSDYVYPYWENDWFFSKPPLTMWLQALGMQLVGTNRTGGALALYTEWGMRLPFVLFTLLSLGLLTLAVKRIANSRAALATAFALLTMPMYFLINRQTVTDTPFVASMTSAVACALIALLAPEVKNRSAWWLGFYVFTGLGFFAKGLLTGIPAAALLLYAVFCVMPFDAEGASAHARYLTDAGFRAQVRAGAQPVPVLWGHVSRMRLGTGLLVFLAIVGPWFLTLVSFDELDDENRTFWGRFLFDHFARIAAGVHTTTPGGEFTYFIQQGSYGMFPWVALLPGVLAMVARLRLRSPSRSDQLALFALLWMLLAFSLVGFSATKFHHYIFPALPALAVLLGLYVDRLWEEGVAAHAVPLILGAILFALVGKDLAENPKNFTDLFVYNYDRPYPQELVTQPLSFLGQRYLWTGDLLALLLIAFGAYLAAEAFRGSSGSVGSRATAIGLGMAGVTLVVSLSTRGRAAPTLFLGLAIAVVAVYLGWEASRAAGQARGRLYTAAAAVGIVAAGLVVAGLRVQPGADPLLVQLTRPVNVKMALGIGFAIAGGLCVLAAIQRARTVLFATFWTLALAFTLWFNWGHWVDLSHHWTQRDLFWRYYSLRKPGEPIAAYLMNWRGETFYSRNTVKQIPPERAAEKMKLYASLPGRKWALVEHNRLGLLKSAAGADKTITPVDPKLNNKFVLVTIE